MVERGSFHNPVEAMDDGREERQAELPPNLYKYGTSTGQARGYIYGENADLDQINTNNPGLDTTWEQAYNNDVELLEVDKEPKDYQDGFQFGFKNGYYQGVEKQISKNQTQTESVETAIAKEQTQVTEVDNNQD